MTDLKINTYPMHIGDWHSGTSRMSCCEAGVYIRLCNQYYLDQGEGWTVNECLRICAAMAKDEQKAVKTVLASKFEHVDGGYRHAGMDKRISEIVAASERNQERARIAAEKRWAREKQSSPDATSNAHGMPEAVLEECHPKAKSQKPIVGSRVSNETLSPSASDFEKFKSAYPPGRGAAAAEKAWNEVVDQGADPYDILTGVANSVAFWNAEGVKGRFIPEAKNYLANRTWLTHAAVTETPKVVPDVSITWDGPDEVLQAVSAEAGDTFARSYLLLSARYDASRDAILTKTETAADKLRRLNRLRDLGYLIEKDAA